MKTITLLKQLATYFPKKHAKMYHDFVGKMTGKTPLEVRKIFLCLDMDEQILPEVLAYHPDMVITHHPLIYGTRAKIFARYPNKKVLCDTLDAANIPVYSYHTNFDAGKNGMNDALTELLDLQNVFTPEKCLSMRIGELKTPMGIMDFAKYAKEKLNVDYSLLIAEGKPQIKRVGIIGGGGSGFYPIAIENNCDIYLSGDAPHHIRREIVNAKFNYLDMPHEIEKAFLAQMKKILLSFDDTLEVKTIDHEKLPMVIQ